MNLQSWARISPLWYIFLFLGCLFFSTIGIRPLANPDEGRYTEIPREMLQSGDWVSPRLNGVLYFEKPPLFYWLQATALKVGGVTEASSRFWTAFMGLLGCVATYFTGKRLFGFRAGIYSALILGSSLLYFALSQIVTLDMTVTVLMTGALYLFLLSVKEPPGKKRAILSHLFFLMLALATLTKGLIGIVIPGSIIFLWALLLKQWRSLWPFYPLTTIPLFLLVAVPWHLLAWRANPEFAWYYFVNEHFLRYLTPDHNRVQPIWYFFVILPLGLIPWTGFLPQSLRHAFAANKEGAEERPELFFLVIWTLFVLIFFSVSKSKMVPYILPVYPALALLIGRALAGDGERAPAINPRPGVIAFSVTSLLLAVVLPLVALHRSGKVAPDTLDWALAVAAVLTAGGITGLVIAARSRKQGILMVPLMTMFVVFILFNPLVDRLKNNTTKDLAIYLREIGAQPEDIYSLMEYHQDLTPYYGACVPIAANVPEEQAFGKAIEPDSALWLDANAFLSAWHQPEQKYAVVKRTHADMFAEEYPGWQAFVLKESNRYLLLSNKNTGMPRFVASFQKDPEEFTKPTAINP